MSPLAYSRLERVEGLGGVPKWMATCRSCGWTYINSVKVDVNEQRRHHGAESLCERAS